MHNKARFEKKSSGIGLISLTEGTKLALQGAILLEGKDGGGQLYVPIAKASFALQALQTNFHDSFTSCSVTAFSRCKNENVSLARIDLPSHAEPSIKTGIETAKIQFASTHPIRDNVDEQLSNIIDRRARHQG